MFETGTRVRFKPDRLDPANDLPANGTFVIGAIVPLPNPDGYFVPSCYWETRGWAWARGKTRLDVAGHPQVIFLEGVSDRATGCPHHPLDPDNMGRRGFSGAWFQAA